MGLEARMNYDELLEHIEKWHRARGKSEKSEISRPTEPNIDQNDGVNSLNSLNSQVLKYPKWPCVNCGGSRFRLATGNPPTNAWICEDCVPVEAN